MAASENASTARTGLTLSVVGEIITFKLTSEQTQGAYTAVEVSHAPGGGVPPHIQQKDDEAFYVLEGTYTFRIGDETVEHGPGGHVFVPRGTVHTFQNTGDTQARVLIIYSPGGFHERFFLDVGIEVHDHSRPPEINMDEQISRVMAAAPKYGMEMLTLGRE